MGGDWKVTDKLKLGAEYTVSYGSVMFGEYNGVFVSCSRRSLIRTCNNYPDINSLMNNLKLTATYEVAPTMDLLLQGTWTYFHNNDWTTPPTRSRGPAPPPSRILTPGYGSPNYSIVTVMTGVKYKF